MTTNLPGGEFCCHKENKDKMRNILTRQENEKNYTEKEAFDIMRWKGKLELPDQIQ